jgi:hypothetical protein
LSSASLSGNSNLNQITKLSGWVRGWCALRSAKMTHVDRNTSEDELIQIIESGVRLLSNKQYQEFIDNFGYTLGEGTPSPQWIIADLKNYESEFYPEETDFEVTDPSLAFGGNSNPQKKVVWFANNEAALVGSVAYDLPLNGQWSDLCAEFVLFETGSPDGYILKLEEISS